VKTLNNAKAIVIVLLSFVVAFFVGRGSFINQPSQAQGNTLTAEDKFDILQLINGYAYGIDTCGNNGYDYANLFTEDGVFIDNNSDAGYGAGGRVLAQGREALAELVGGGSRG
jgi:hypothetical protein